MDRSQTPFPDQWDDEKDAERYKQHAREVYDHYRRYQEAAYTGHMEYGKWLIASLLAVHGGAIYAISSLRTAVNSKQIGGLIESASWNLAGVFFVLLAGFFAWLNFQCAEQVYNRWANPAMLYREDKIHVESPRFDAINACLWLAAFFGLLSGYSFLVSSVKVVQTLHNM